MNIYNERLKKIKSIEFYDKNLKGKFLKFNYMGKSKDDPDIINENTIVYCFTKYGDMKEKYAKELEPLYYVIGFRK
jgi:hypothetical protein